MTRWETLRFHVRCFLQHYLNPLHFFARLMNFGMNAVWAGRVAWVYQKLYNISGLR